MITLACGFQSSTKEETSLVYRRDEEWKISAAPYQFTAKTAIRGICPWVMSITAYHRQCQVHRNNTNFSCRLPLARVILAKRRFAAVQTTWEISMPHIPLLQRLSSRHRHFHQSFMPFRDHKRPPKTGPMLPIFLLHKLKDTAYQQHT